MTPEELRKIPFYFVGSLAMEDEHLLSYESEDGRLGFCDYTPKREDGTFGRTYRHYRIEGEEYKKKDKFIAALADFKPNVLTINHRPYQNPMARMKREQEAKPSAIFVDMPKPKQ